MKTNYIAYFDVYVGVSTIVLNANSIYDEYNSFHF